LYCSTRRCPARIYYIIDYWLGDLSRRFIPITVWILFLPRQRMFTSTVYNWIIVHIVVEISDGSDSFFTPSLVSDAYKTYWDKWCVYVS
jgi:hypothetical protein